MSGNNHNVDLERAVETLQAQLDRDQGRVSDAGFTRQIKGTATIARWVVGIIVAAVSVLGYVETRIAASAGHEREVVLSRAYTSSETVARTVVESAHLASREDVVRQEQRLVEIDRRLGVIDAKLDTLLASRR